MPDLNPSAAATGHWQRGRRERGGATVVFTALLLLATALALLYVNRALIFDQRTSAHQARITLAGEAAQAGLEWAIGMLNADDAVDTSCRAVTTGGRSFRAAYLMPGMDTTPRSYAISPPAVRLGCKLTDGGLSCSCPTTDANYTPGTDEAPGFAVTFASVSGDPQAVQVTSRGCTAHADACPPPGTSGAVSADATTVVTAVVKMPPLVPAVPAVPLTCGLTCSLSGSYALVNNDVSTNGVVINAGVSATLGSGVRVDTLPGTPPANAVVAPDPVMAAIAGSGTCDNSAMFQTYLGTTIESFRESSETEQISCASAAECQQKLTDAYDRDKKRAFFFLTDVTLSGNNSFAQQNDPVVIVTDKSINIRGDWTIFGLLFSNNALVNDTGTGSLTIQGAQVSCAGYNNNGDGATIYDPVALNNLLRLPGTATRVPGSWKDF